LTRARIGGIVDLSTIDWYGKITSVTFFAGCNFRCPYCQNAGLIPLESGKELGTDDIVKRLQRNLDIVDAAGFTGGEPCLQGEALKELARKGKAVGLKVFLNTNGSNPRIISDMIEEGLLDYVALDVKAPLDPAPYGRAIGRPELGEAAVHNVKATLEICLKAGITLEIRTTIVPGLIDQEEDIREVSNEIARAQLYVLQQFSPEGDLLDQNFKNVTPPTRETLTRLARVALECGAREVRIRTKERGEETIQL